MEKERIDPVFSNETSSYVGSPSGIWSNIDSYAGYTSRSVVFG